MEMSILFFRRGVSQRRIAKAIREGVGVTEFRLRAPGEGEGDGRQVAIDGILSAVRDAMGRMRRPYGIDQVALALACRDHDGQILCANTLGVIRPAAFYGAEGEERIAAFMDDVEAMPAERRCYIDGALLSVGDLAYQLSEPQAA